jgi:hypothetical protein
MTLSQVTGGDMARLSKSDAARCIGVARQTLHRYLNEGRLSASPDGTIDTAELLRAGFTLREIPVTRDVTPVPRLRQEVTSPMTPVTPPVTSLGEVELLRQMVALLQRELDDAKQEKLRLLGLVEQQHRLLEVGRGPSPQGPPRAPNPSPREEDRGAMRQRIVTLLHEHPDGLRTAEVRARLGLEKPLHNTMRAMARDGLVRRVAIGRYVVAED